MNTPKESTVDPREADVLELCNQVLRMSPKVWYNNSGPDQTTCPLCHSQQYGDLDIEELTHESNCGWLIAKDLLTNTSK